MNCQFRGNDGHNRERGGEDLLGRANPWSPTHCLHLHLRDDSSPRLEDPKSRDVLILAVEKSMSFGPARASGRLAPVSYSSYAVPHDFPVL